MPLKIGEKEYTDEQLAAAIQASDRLAQLEQQVAPVLEAAKKYSLDVKDFVQNAEGGFDAIVQLQEAGLIDEHLNVVEKKAAAPAATPGTTPKAMPDKNSVEAIVAQALETRLKPLVETVEQVSKKIGGLDDTQSRLLRERMLARVQGKHPNLEEEEISMLVAKATRTKEDFWKLAEEKATQKEAKQKEIIDNFAKEHGLDLGNLNKIKEMKSDDGAIATAVVEGKKVSSRGGPDTISPKEATINYFKTLDQLGERN